MHRDVKPENVLIGTDGRAQIADFGIARSSQGLAPLLTAPGVAIGTPAYMAPEQRMGGDIGPRTDLYSVGAVAYEIVTGRPPGTAPGPALAAAGLDAGIATWIETMLATDPAARPADVALAWEALEQHVIALLGPRWPAQAALVPRPLAGAATPRSPSTASVHSTPAPAPAPTALRWPAPRAFAAAIALVAVAIAAIFAISGDGDSGDGGLAVKPGPGGCITEEDGPPGCAIGDGLYGAVAVAVSPDGANAYVAAYDNSAVAILDRDPGTGALSSRAGRARCFAQGGASGACRAFHPLSLSGDVAVSADGRSVYVASSGASAVTVFDRDPADGGLALRGGRDRCLSVKERACEDARAIRGANAVAVSPDDRSVYVTAYDSNAVVVFDRAARDGRLTQKRGPAGCLSGRRGASCADAAALDGPQAVTVSGDGRSVYVASSGASAVTVFDRDPADGALTMKPGASGCVAGGATHGRCALVRGLAVGDAANAIAVSPDSRHVYVASAQRATVAVFDRRPDGGLMPKPGHEGCLSRDGSRGRCTAVPVLDGASSVTIAADGKTAFVASSASGTVAALERDGGSGALTLKPGRAYCVSHDGAGGRCARAPTLADARTVALSPDGRHLYVASYESNAVTILDRR